MIAASLTNSPSWGNCKQRSFCWGPEPPGRPLVGTYTGGCVRGVCVHRGAPHPALPSRGLPRSHLSPFAGAGEGASPGYHSPSLVSAPAGDAGNEISAWEWKPKRGHEVCMSPPRSPGSPSISGRCPCCVGMLLLAPSLAGRKVSLWPAETFGTASPRRVGHSGTPPLLLPAPTCFSLTFL